jgi:hypothetical protein
MIESWNTYSMGSIAPRPTNSLNQQRHLSGFVHVGSAHSECNREWNFSELILSLWILRHLAGLLERRIGPLEFFYLYRTTQHRVTRAYKHPYLRLIRTCNPRVLRSMAKRHYAIICRPTYNFLWCALRCNSLNESLQFEERPRGKFMRLWKENINMKKERFAWLRKWSSYEVCLLQQEYSSSIKSGRFFWLARKCQFVSKDSVLWNYLCKL